MEDLSTKVEEILQEKKERNTANETARTGHLGTDSVSQRKLLLKCCYLASK